MGRNKSVWDAEKRLLDGAGNEQDDEDSEETAERMLRVELRRKRWGPVLQDTSSTGVHRKVRGPSLYPDPALRQPTRRAVPGHSRFPGRHPPSDVLCFMSLCSPGSFMRQTSYGCSSSQY